MALLTMSSMPSVMLKTPTPSPSGIPEAAVNDSGDWRDILNKYTGWFITAGGSRIVITLDYSQLRISEQLSEAQGGAITSSYDLSLPDGDVSEAIMTKANLETVNFGDLKDMVKAQSGADVVLFSIEEGEVTGVGFNGKAYETTDPGVCSFLKLSVELRASVWKDILVTDQGYVVLKRTPDKENSVIISADLKTPWNRIREICQDNCQEARFLELTSNRLHTSEMGLLLNLLKIRVPAAGQYVHNIKIFAKWGPKHFPVIPDLHDLIQFARAHPEKTIKILFQEWKLLSRKGNGIGDFLVFGWGARQAMRGVSGGPTECSSVTRELRGNRSLREMNAPNVKFYSAQPASDELIMNKINAGLKTKVMEKLVKVYGVPTMR